MAKIVRREFVGSRLLLFFLFIIPLCFPFAIIYLIESTVTVEEEMENPTAFLEAFRAGKVGR